MDAMPTMQAVEDACRYRIFAPRSSADQLPTLAADMLARVHSLCADYIWQRDSFTLAVAERPEARHLEGRTAFGDCVDDEWLIVWLLRELSQRWTDVAISIEDADGEFLLIEAAEVLPRWVSPTNAENRVWISNGRLHLIPLEHRSERTTAIEGAEEDDEGFISTADALRLVLDPTVDTFAPSSVEKTVWRRIATLPGSITATHLHRTLAYLPADIASALAHRPQLIAPAVQAFYERDPLQLKACQAMARFSPGSAESEPVLVQMTRPLYGQLVAQRFYAPKPCERADWFKGATEGTAEHRRRDLGLKIACGFEMLFAETKSRLRTGTVDRPAENARATDPGYKRFIQRLAQTNYFRGEVEGSALYVELERAAREQWREYLADPDAQPAFAQQVEDALASKMPIAPSTGQEDSDAWMELDPDDLERILAERRGDGAAADDEDLVADAQADQLGELADKFESFVEGQGSLDGAMFDDELSDEDGDSSDEDEPEPLTGAAREDAMAKLVTSLPAADWGRKPAPTSEAVAPPPQRPRAFEAEKYDGASDSDESDDDAMDEGAGGELDMASEMDEFLKFTREALGLSEAQYDDILKSRRDRGAFVPTSSKAAGKAAVVPPVEPVQAKPTPAPVPAPPEPTPTEPNGGEVEMDEGFAPGPAAGGARRSAKWSSTPRNPNLASFDALMDAMDASLSAARQPAAPSPSSSAPPSSKSKGQSKPAAPVARETDEDEDAMDAELAEALERDPAETDAGGGSLDYGLIKNFLESYSSQAGRAGPVSNLAGRLDPTIRLPRDTTR